MNNASKTSKIAKAAGLEAADLLKRATQQPGVADLLRLYEQHAERVRQSAVYLQQRDVLLTFTTSDATV